MQNDEDNDLNSYSDLVISGSQGPGWEWGASKAPIYTYDFTTAHDTATTK